MNKGPGTHQASVALFSRDFHELGWIPWNFFLKGPSLLLSEVMGAAEKGQASGVKSTGTLRGAGLGTPRQISSEPAGHAR